MARKHQSLIKPYGGNLIQAYAEQKYRSEISGTHPSKLPRINLTSNEFFDLHMLASGAYSPLDGYMDKETYYSVCDKRELPSGLPWGLPITLSVSDRLSSSFNPGMEAALFYQSIPVAILFVKDIFKWDKQYEIARIYSNRSHDFYVSSENRLRDQDVHLIGGKISLLIPYNKSPLPKSFLNPKAARNLLIHGKLRKMASVLTGIPWARSHEYSLKSILECADGLLVHIANDRMYEDITLPKDVARDLIKKGLSEYFPTQGILSSIVYNDYARHTSRGILHTAIVSQNYGCECLFIKEESGKKDYRNEAEKTIDKARSNGLDIDVSFMDHAFYCETCDNIATKKTCHHESTKHIVSDEQELIRKIYAGEHIPSQLIRPEIARFVSRAISIKSPTKHIGGGRHIYPHAAEISQGLRYSVTGHKGSVLWLTGLSGSGKSTIASRLEKDLLLTGHRVFLLDGDGLRNGLCSDLDFSREARRENLRRAGEICKLLSDAGQLVIASFISPYKKERLMIREIVGEGFHEVYVQANLETCEARDPKGLYQRARAGIIPEFTGITSPYEIPDKPAITIDTTLNDVDSCAQYLLQAMREIGLLCSSDMSAGYPKVAEPSWNEFPITLKGD